jgi:hypothetical protein
MIYKINNVTLAKEGGFDRVSFTYDEIDDTGKTLSVNNRLSRVVTDDSVVSAINVLNKYVLSVIEGE